MGFVLTKQQVTNKIKKNEVLIPTERKLPMTKHALGMEGQSVARQFLEKNGYTVLFENYRLRSCEIDIIARHGDFTVFIEVKFRKGLLYGLPRESVSRLKQKRIIKAAMHYITAKQPESEFRFDVVEVLEKGGKTYVNHIVDAFQV